MTATHPDGLIDLRAPRRGFLIAIRCLDCRSP